MMLTTIAAPSPPRTNARRLISCAGILVTLLVWLIASPCSAALQFVLGHYYTTDFVAKTTIVEYDENGFAVRSLNLAAGHELRGLGFGPDHLLYVVDSQPDQFNVFAITPSGTVQQTYSQADPGGIRSLISAGHIDFDEQGHFYVDHYRFTIGAPNSGVDFYSGGPMYDVAVLPNGNLLGVNDHDLFEVTPAGSYVRSIAPSPDYFLNKFLRAVEYDRVSDSIYVAMLGDSNLPHPLFKLDGTTGALLTSTKFSNATDLFLTMDHGLVGGSRSERPTRFTSNLQLVGFLQGTSTDRMFVTQLVPEPSTWILATAGLLGLLRCARGFPQRR